jgi:CHAT domain-containing protein
VVLSFQLSSRESHGPAPRFEGGSWVIAITRDEARAFPLPDEGQLQDRVSVFLGLCRRREGSELDAATILFEELLGDALHAIGSRARRIVLVPDGCLHGFPFVALRPRPGEPPLGTTHEITQVPSVSHWLQLRDTPGPFARSHAPPYVLALADPDLSSSVEADELRSARPWLEGLRLGALPRARAETDSLVRTLGGESRMATGIEASERLLKQTELRRFGILHLAAHAVVDFDHPDRSAVVLAPGGSEEDGFLQVREIVDLDLEGRVVILSACRSASGTVLRGEGMLGLATAFLQAGAHAVVGNLWPLRDDDAEPLVREMGSHLAQGRSLAAALTEARAARARSGAPAAAWAGLVVIGDGDMVPVPDGAGAEESVWWFPALGLALLLGVSILAWLIYKSLK